MKTLVTEDALICGSADEVWSLITDPANVQKWYAFGGSSIDLRPGGEITMQWDEHGLFLAVVEAVEPARLFSFRWLPTRDPLVEITLESVSEDTTRVRIVESGDLEDPDQSALAWRNGLALLKQLSSPQT